MQESLDQAENTLSTDVLIIGAGATGAGIMRDLALRGIHSILIDKEDLCAGASGGNHGLLHSGARYVYKDLHSAIECREENTILRNCTPQCIEETGGYFVAVEGDEQDYIDDFPQMCAKAGISCEKISVEEALQKEPSLSPKTIAVYAVPDATIDPFRLVLDNIAHAKALNESQYLSHTKLESFEKEDGKIQTAQCLCTKTGQKLKISAKQIINAAGAWAMDVAKLAGCENIRLLYSKGTLLVSNDRITKRVINRLRPPGNGDILVPGGTVSILGTTSLQTENLEKTRPTVDEVNENVLEGMAMIPELVTTRYIRAFARIRPLVLMGEAGDSRSVARSFSIFDHNEQGVENFVSITGGKLTTYRLMAEKTVDLIAQRLGNSNPCITRTEKMPENPVSTWTDPKAIAIQYFSKQDPDDTILCECEMLPQSAINEIISESKNMTLESIALRSRMGKGPCQGSFCGIRVASHLYDQEYYKDKQGLQDMKDFFNERFKGTQSIIWGEQMAQMELAEALHSGLLGLDCLDENKED